MKIYDFVNSLRIDPKRDIEPRYKLVKEIEADTSGDRMCYNCGDRSNIETLKSSSTWVGIVHCRRCDCLNVIHHQDRMGGATEDTVKCYTDK